MKRAIVAFVLGSAWAVLGFARNESGTLTVIRVPNNGQPALVVHGASFTVRATAEADIFAGHDGTLHDLSEQWRPLPGGVFEATVVVPTDFPPGLYSVVAESGGKEDVQSRALLVLEEPPNQYDLAHVASPRMHNGIEATLAGAFLENAPLALIVSGDLTANGAPDDFRTLLDWLDSSEIPTIVAPGPRDSAQGLYGEYFDSAPHATWCGRDAILSIGETETGAEDVGEAGAYQRIRRAMKPARWSLGVTGYAHTALNTRLQIILFVDTPLNALVAGRAEQTEDGIGRVVWDSFQGPTQIISPPKYAKPGLQWIRVSRAGIGIVQAPNGNER